MNVKRLSITEFAKHYGACADGRKWALDHCANMAAVWDAARPDWLIWIATRDGVLDDKTLRLFACFCARQNWHLLTDERSRNAVEVAERFANGLASDDELAAARDAARAARDAAWAAAREASVAASVAWAAWEAARDAQSVWLRTNVPNPFLSTEHC